MNCSKDHDVSLNGPTAHTVSNIVDGKVAKLIAVGAAMAANSEPGFTQAVSESERDGVSKEAIRAAVEMGQLVKDKPATLLKKAADVLTGTNLTAKPTGEGCPADKMKRGAEYNLTMLIGAGAAMAAGCEPCLNKVVPGLIEAGVAEADIRKAVEIGQAARDRSASIMKEAAEVLAGATFAESPEPQKCSTNELNPVGRCCG